MLTARIIPCLDCRGAEVVKGISFGELRTMGDPVELAGYYHQEGADELVVLDISATIESRKTRTDLIHSIRRSLSIPMTAGGGVQSLQDVELLLNAGADKVSVNTAAIKQPDLLDELAKRFGSQCIVLAIDARQTAAGWTLIARSGTDDQRRSALEWAYEAVERGAGEILLTSWDNDGRRSGYDIPLLSEMAARVQVPIIISGGAGTASHLSEACQTGATGLLVASMLHDGSTTINQLKLHLQDSGIPVRL